MAAIEDLDLTKLRVSDENFDPAMEEKTRVTTSIFDVTEKRADGGVSFVDQKEIDAQRVIIWDFVKKVGMHLLKGGSLTKISMPIGLSQPITYLQHVAREFWLAPVYLHQAAEAQDPVERLKFVMAFVIGGLHRQCYKQHKPLNPILGETYQASFFDGTRIFMEQISHHPPVSAFDMEAPSKWRLTGAVEASANFSGTTVEVGRTGPQSILFADGTRISWDYPGVSVGGIIYGNRYMEVVGEMTFTDAKNGLRASLRFDSESKKGGWFGSGSVKAATDLFRGAISKVSDNSQVVGFYGSWLDHLTFESANGKGEQRVWDIRAILGYSWIEPDAGSGSISVLPSDSQFREDARALERGNLDEAQSEKERLEQLQRADAKLRKESAQKHGRKHGH